MPGTPSDDAMHTSAAAEVKEPKASLQSLPSLMVALPSQAELSQKWKATKKLFLKSQPEEKAALQKQYTSERLLQEFVKEAPFTIEQLNILIQKYNQQPDATQQLMILQNIRRQQQQIDHKYRLSFFTSLPSYNETLHVQLFKALKTQFAHYGFSSIEEQGIQGKSMPEGLLATLPLLLSNMEPEKISCLLQILSNGAAYDPIDFSQLYQGVDSPEAHAFTHYFRQHELTFVGGINAQVFKISPRDNPQDALIFKVDNRLNNPRDAEIYLREQGLDHIFTTIFAERPGTYSDKRTGNLKTSVLVITEFCQEGNLIDHASRQTTVEQKIEQAIAIYTQMAQILLQIQAKHCAFPDMKNLNWLVNKQGQLKISDTKSIAYSNDKGELNYKLPVNHWYKKVHTKDFDPPELKTRHAVIADKMHVFMLGKNLYQYLTGCPSDKLSEKNDGDHYCFDMSIFKTPHGLIFKALIQTMIKPQASERLSLQKVHQQLTILVNDAAIMPYEDALQRCKNIHETAAANPVSAAAATSSISHPDSDDSCDTKENADTETEEEIAAACPTFF